MSANWQSISQEFSQPDLFNLIYKTAVFHGFPVALWRYPDKSAKQAAVDLNGGGAFDLAAVEENVPCFVMAPFSPGASAMRIRADLRVTPTGIHLLDENGSTASMKRKFEETLIGLASGKHRKQWCTPAVDGRNPRSTQESDYCRWVREAVDAIHAGQFRKVVLSRTQMAELPDDFEPLAFFDTLCQRYPNAFVSLVSAPEIGTWIGATPEMLLQRDHRGFSTVALAGTRPKPHDIPISAFQWAQKEIEEQSMVSEFIRDALHQLGIREFREHSPRTIAIGELIHLLTRFEIDHPENAAEMEYRLLRALHLTPAVCGLPKNEALQFITQSESHQREFYSGFLGTLQFEQQTRLFVNLRCLQLMERAAILYAGAGITQDSVPEKEWTETEQKLDALRSCLRPALDEIALR